MEMELSECPGCRGGEVLNPSTGKVEACPTCHGIGVTTPGLICQCGRSCADADGEFYFCGNADCLKALKESKRLDSIRSTGWSRTPATFQPNRATAHGNVDWYNDGQFPSMVH